MNPAGKFTSIAVSIPGKGVTVSYVFRSSPFLVRRLLSALEYHYREGNKDERSRQRRA
jgi:hypothetical protein